MEVDGADLAGIVVHVVHPWVGEMADMLDSLAMQFSLYNEWDIWVEMESAGSESAVVETLQSDIAGNDLPGIVVVPPTLLNELDGQFYTVNLMNYYNDAEWGLSAEEQAGYPRGVLECLPVGWAAFSPAGCSANHPVLFQPDLGPGIGVHRVADHIH